MLKLQKYALPIDINPKLTGYYISAYLEIQLRENQHKRISQIVSQTNQNLTSNLTKLKDGKFDNLNFKFNLNPCSTIQLNLPFEILTRINLNQTSSSTDLSDEIYNNYFKDRLINPSNLDIDGWWPNDFKSISLNLRTSDYHVSLLPLIIFNNEMDSIGYFIKIKKLFQHLNNAHKYSFKFGSFNKVNVLSKFDFNKFFLTIPINRDDNLQLNQLQRNLYNLRYEILSSKGYVNGELENSILDWNNSMLHMSIGVCNRIDNSIGFGQDELFFMNECLLDNKINSEKDHDTDTYSDLEFEGRVVIVLNGTKIKF